MMGDYVWNLMQESDAGYKRKSRSNLHFDLPRIVSHHGGIPAALVPLLHHSYILKGSFSVLITDCTHVGAERVKVRMQEVHID